MKLHEGCSRRSGKITALARSAGLLFDKVFGADRAARVAEFIYTTLLKPPFIRAIANRLILSVLPPTVVIGGATVVINQRDPVISGALALGVYENSEIAFMRRVCAPGQVVLDIGANVGLYTAIAGTTVGPTGRVVAFEPDPESALLLEQTVRANNLHNVRVVQAAASDRNGRGELFLSHTNRGDNRLHPSAPSSEPIDVECIRLDDYLAAEEPGSVVDIIKMDVQGFEGHVIEGLEKTLQCSPRLKILMEFWPEGLSSAGTDPLDLLERFERSGLALFELKSDGDVDPVMDKRQLIDRLKGRKYASLVLLGREAGGALH
jgi:FkbM family methyltransferase